MSDVVYEVLVFGDFVGVLGGVVFVEWGGVV